MIPPRRTDNQNLPKLANNVRVQKPKKKKLKKKKSIIGYSSTPICLVGEEILESGDWVCALLFSCLVIARQSAAREASKVYLSWHES